MNAVDVALLAAAGGVGAGLRHLLDRALSGRRPADAFPIGILVVNAIGSFALGVLTGLGDVIGAAWPAVIGVGLLGGFTTFSTMALDTVRLARAGRRDRAWANLLGTFVVCVLLAGVGLMLGSLRPLG